MNTIKADIIAQLQKEILSLQGFKSILHNNVADIALGPITNAFPNATFPFGAIHEFIGSTTEDVTSAAGFIAGIIGLLIRDRGACVWINSSQTIFPPALASFGIEPDKIIFVELKKEKEILWAIEEALKCDGLAAVVGELPQLSFTASRRFQLAVEQSGVTGFIFNKSSKELSTTASIARWKISSLPGILPDDIPGIGFSCWNVELLKARNGKPGNWQLKYENGKFLPLLPPVSMISVLKKKTG